MKKSAQITNDEIRRLFHYDESKGHLIWRQRLSIRTAVGRVAGTPTSGGYIKIGVRGVQYLAHRLVWNYVNGNWPVGDIDHIDGNRANNRIENLRDVSTHQNMQNLKRSHRDNSAGLLGVERHREKWVSRICVEGKRTYLGSFATKEEAHAAYVAAKRILHVCGTL